MILRSMTAPEKLRFCVRLSRIRMQRRRPVDNFWPATLAAIAGMILVIILAAGCDFGATAVPDQLRTTACVVESVPAGLAVLDDAIADVETQATKIRDGVPIVAEDTDGPTAIVNAATAIRVCMESE